MLLISIFLVPMFGHAKYSADEINKMLNEKHIPGEAVVKVKNAGALTAQSFHSFGEFGVTEAKAFETSNSFYLVKISKVGALANFLTALNNDDRFEYAEPNYIYSIGMVKNSSPVAEVVPNDQKFSELWGMKNTGQSGGVAGADIDATIAWNRITDSRDIIVAVIDTGVDYTHEDLRENIYINPGEIEGDGIDNDNNGFVDDVRGWRFLNNESTNDPMDDHSHGTHVSGTIGAKGNNGIGVAGVTWNVRILPIKFLSGSGSGSLADAVKSIQYATKMGVHIMSNSWGGGGFSQAMADAIEESKNAGILFVAAAGNSGTNNDQRPHYPSNYQFDNVVSVAATTRNEGLASFSCYGKRTVHIAAPGHETLSTVLRNGYKAYSGTSMATPHVSGAAALLWQHMGAGSADYKQVRARLMASSDKFGVYSRKIAYSGRLNINNAIEEIYPPSNDIPEDRWQDFPLQAPVETPHPYQDNSNLEFVIEGPANAKHMRIVFDRFELESRYDTVKVVAANGQEVETLTGGLGRNVKTWHVDGNKVKLIFTSDRSVNKWGFKVEIGRAHV